jgi:hypothetical protein
MPDGEVPVEVILQDNMTKEIDRVTVIVTADTPGKHTFRDLPAGTYIVQRDPPRGIPYIGM